MSEDFIYSALVSGGVLGGLLLFIPFVWLVLCIVLFFKVWGMTNDVRDMKEMFEKWFDLEHPVITEKPANPDDKQDDVSA